MSQTRWNWKFLDKKRLNKELKKQSKKSEKFNDIQRLIICYNISTPKPTKQLSSVLLAYDSSTLH